MEFDFIVIGAGPIGSYISQHLAEDGFTVAIFDRKSEIGENVICSGIIGSKPYKEYGLPEEAIINKISQFKIYSPSMIGLEFSKDEPFAYIADRICLDRILFERAMNAGVEPFLSKLVVDVISEDKRIGIKYLHKGKTRDEFARCLIIATGSNFALHRKAGLLPPDNFLWGSRVEFEEESEGPLEIFILNDPDMGPFGWVIPIDDRTRIGTVSEEYDRGALYNLVQKNNGRFMLENHRIEGAPIACGNSRKMVSNRVICAGEAAGQVKTTTGGGIHYGLIGATLAIEVLKESAENNDFSRNKLLQYERTWRCKMGSQIKSGMVLRNLVSKLPSKTVDIAFQYINEDEKLMEDFKENFSFDYHRDMVELARELIMGRGRNFQSRIKSIFNNQNHNPD